MLVKGERRGGRMEGSVTTMLPRFDFYFRRCDRVLMHIFFAVILRFYVRRV